MKHIVSLIVLVIFLILAAGSADLGGSRSEPTSAPPPSPAPREIHIENESRAAPIDIENARLFFKEIPKECDRTTASVAEDGTLTVKYFCIGNGKVGTGTFRMKNGIVTSIE
jgi:hypothetical protein